MQSGSSRERKQPSRKSLPEYSVWKGMRKRCKPVEQGGHPRYGGAGIIVCPEWDDFLVFYADMGPRPSSRHALDRVGGAKVYSKATCRWATPEEEEERKRPRKFYGRKARSLSYDPVTLQKRPPVADVPEYVSWREMRYRCYRQNHGSYYNYGAKGITVCAAWDADFWEFLSDVGVRPSERHSLDRKDGRLGYWCGKCEECVRLGHPKNVRWAPPDVQQNNLLTNRKIEWGGENLTSPEWSRRTGLPDTTIYCRFFQYGWDAERTLTTSVLAEIANRKHEWSTGTKKTEDGRTGQIISFAGLDLTMTEWGVRLNLDPELIRKRLDKGMTVKEALLKKHWEHSSQHKPWVEEKDSGRDRYVEHAGERLRIHEWALLYAIDRNLLYSRYCVEGKDFLWSLTTPSDVEQALEKSHLAVGITRTKGGMSALVYPWRGEEHTLAEWSKIRNIPENVLRARIARNPDLDWALGTPCENTRPCIVSSEEAVGRRHSGKGGQPPLLFRYKDREQTLQEWAEETEVPVGTYRQRMRNGRTFVECVEMALQKPKTYKLGDEEHVLSEWSKIKDIPIGVLRARIHNKWSDERMLTEPYNPRK